MNTHAMFITRQDGNLIGDCLCGWECETTGADESARRYVEGAYDRHQDADTGETVHWVDAETGVQP